MSSSLRTDARWDLAWRTRRARTYRGPELEAESQRTCEARSSRALMRRVIRFICAPGRLRSCGVGSNNGGCGIIIIIPCWQFERSFGKGHFPSPLEHAPKGCRCAGLVLIA